MREKPRATSKPEARARRPGDVLSAISKGVDLSVQNLQEQVRLALDTVAGPWTPERLVDSWRKSVEMTWDGYREVSELWLDSLGWPVPEGLRRTPMSGGQAAGELRYKQTNGNPEVSPPFRFENVLLKGFTLQAASHRLLEICDRQLNSVLAAAGEPGRYRPITCGPPSRQSIPSHSAVFLQLSHYPTFYSTSPEYRDYGRFSQDELCFTVPVIQWVDDLPVKLGLLLTHTFVDDSWSAITGRCVLGYNKVGSTFSRSLRSKRPSPVKVSTQVFKKYGPKSRLSKQEIAVIGATRPSADAAGPKPDIHPQFGPYQDLFGPQGVFELESDLFDFFTDQLDSSLYYLLGLKQFRLASDPGLACYQSVVEAGVSDLEIPEGLLLEPVSIRLPVYDSLQIAEDLGLTPSADGAIQPVLPFEIECDFDIKECREIAAPTALRSR